MIEAQAKLKGGPVFFAGEKIACAVTFRNVNQDHFGHQSSTKRDGSEILAWASAQIVCICSVNPHKVIDSAFGTNTNHVSLTSTSLSPSRGEHGRIIFSTKPKILVCDLSLAPAQSFDYSYEETLPSDLPPSFRGQAVKYSYKLKIGLQKVSSPVKMLHLPLRLITWQTLGLPIYHDEEDMVVRNPFLKSSPRDSQFDQALEAMQLLSSRRSPSVYKVTNSQGKVVSLCLFKTNYRLGEDIIGTLDFTDGVVSCMQYSVTLQSQEMVTEEKRRLGGNVQQSRSSNEETSMVVSHSKHHEFSVGFVETHMSLPVPLHVTPSFDTDMVVLKWRLHFEFVTSVKPIDWGSKAETETHWQPPQKADIETMVWDFPVVIYPTAPAHISKAFHTQRDAAITV